MNHEETNYAETILNAGRELARQASVLTTPVGDYLIVPQGLDAKSLASAQKAPRRLEQSVAVDTPSSFIDYVRLFPGDRRPIVFANLKVASPVITAVLDYHAGPDAPSWNQHHVTLPLVFARPFGEWYAANKKAMTQADFAAFVENHIGQIGAPAGGTLHEMCLKFEATKSVEFKSHHRVTDGSVQFTYNEDVQGTVIGKEMKMPADMTLILPVYDDAAPVEVNAKIRYRIADGGRLSIWFELQNVEDKVEAERTAVATRIAVALKDVVRGVIFGRL